MNDQHYSCSIIGCDPRSLPYKVGIFQIPKPSDEREKAWRSFISKYQKYDNRMKICSEHFEPKHLSNMRQYSMGFTRRLLLTKTAVPSIHPLDSSAPSKHHITLDTPDSAAKIQTSSQEPRLPQQVTLPGNKGPAKMVSKKVQVMMDLDVDAMVKETRASEANKSSPDISMENVLKNREVDMLHSALMMRTMYLQQKRDWCCDCTILIPYDPDDNTLKPNFDAQIDGTTVQYYKTRSGYEFKVHSSVLAVASERIRKTLNENEATTIVVNGITKESMLRFIEIVYLGKLKDLIKIYPQDIRDIFKTAESLDSPLVKNYLKRECSHIFDGKSAPVESVQFYPNKTQTFPLNSSTVNSKVMSLTSVKVANLKKQTDSSIKNFLHSKYAVPSGIALMKASQETIASTRKRLSLLNTIQDLKRKKLANANGDSEKRDSEDTKDHAHHKSDNESVEGLPDNRSHSEVQVDDAMDDALSNDEISEEEDQNDPDFTLDDDAA